MHIPKLCDIPKVPRTQFAESIEDYCDRAENGEIFNIVEDDDNEKSVGVFIPAKMYEYLINEIKTLEDYHNAQDTI